MNRQVSKLISTPEVNLRLSNLLLYSLNDATSALNTIKKCLHQDPENKDCKKDFRMLKNVSKSLTQLHKFHRRTAMASSSQNPHQRRISRTNQNIPQPT